MNEQLQKVNDYFEKQAMKSLLKSGGQVRDTTGAVVKPGDFIVYSNSGGLRYGVVTEVPSDKTVKVKRFFRNEDTGEFSPSRVTTVNDVDGTLFIMNAESVGPECSESVSRFRFKLAGVKWGDKE